jgi:hypothetical protein
MMSYKSVLINRKGLGPIAIALVVIAALLSTEGIAVTNFFADSEVIKRSARETSIIDAVDTVEFSKKYIDNAVSYSFYKASYDVLQMGGFCRSDLDCTGTCQIPVDVPTKDCIPWWLIYGDTYAPTADIFEDYLINKTLSLFSDYSTSSIGPAYCAPQGNAIISDIGSYLIQLDIRNQDSAILRYEKKNINLIERITNFTGIFGESALEMFGYARGTFVENDEIGKSFYYADSAMEEDCKNIYLGDVCDGTSAQDICETQLQTKCSEYDIENHPCDFNKDSVVDADEKYNCTVQAELGKTRSSDDNVFRATVSIDNCIKVGHITEAEYEEIAVDWNEYYSALQSGGSLLSTVQAECNELSDCGCADICEEGEGCTIPQCNSDGTCPTQSEIDAACANSATNCGYYSSCTQICQEYYCSYSEENPCEVVVGCEGDCYLDGCECVPNDPECSDSGLCECDPVIEERYDCEHECCQGGQSCSRYGCVFNWQCNENTCGNTCCQRMNTLYKDLECNYNYVGTANTSVEVTDVKYSYPIGDSWQSLKTSFLIASGNAAGCDSAGGGSLCCPAVTTSEMDENRGCKI